MYKLEKEQNKNYQAKLVKLPAPTKHPNADRLQIFVVDLNNIITTLDYKEGDEVVIFPVGCAVNKDLIRRINAFSNPELNEDKQSKGFFGDKARVRAINLRSVKSEGWALRFDELSKFAGGLTFKEGIEFDTANGVSICNKFITKQRDSGAANRTKESVRMSRLVENQVRLHVDTENLRRNLDKLSPNDLISLHYKKHGTSWWVGNLLVKRKLTWKEKLAKLFGVRVQETEYDYVYGSRRVVKNEFETRDAGHFYSYDLWGDIKDQISQFIPKGFTLYGEAIGYTKTGEYIQKGFDYGCDLLSTKMKIYVYRITFTNTDGQVYELEDNQIAEFCNKYGLRYNDTFLVYEKAGNIYPDIPVDENWAVNFVKRLEEDYLEKDCYMCDNKVPAEGIVLRVNKLFSYTAYKLKSFRFLEWEDKEAEKEIVNIEDTN